MEPEGGPHLLSAKALKELLAGEILKIVDDQGLDQCI